MRPARPGRQDRLRSGRPLTLIYTAATVRSSGAQRGSDGPQVSRRSRPHGGRLARPAAATMAREHVCRGGAVWSARCAAPSPGAGRAKSAAPLGAVGQPAQQEEDDGRARVQPVERLRRRSKPVRAQSAGAQRQTLPPGALFQRCLGSTERRCQSSGSSRAGGMRPHIAPMVPRTKAILSRSSVRCGVRCLFTCRLTSSRTCCLNSVTSNSPKSTCNTGRGVRTPAGAGGRERCTCSKECHRRAGRM